ncbi:MAG: hypothetical protein Q7S07_04015 [Candidatus Omnitrophota bacterium]|nr:hypothetical protein [Candidatus Omnitrophota bacterium]
MKLLSLALVLCMALAAIGCERISKPYIMTVDRVDQKVDGNKGYLTGTPPPSQERANLKRSLIAVDMDFVELKGKPTQQTVLITKEGKKAIFPSASETAENENIK